WLMMSLWDALRMNMMISYQELVRTFPNDTTSSPVAFAIFEL
ncbi:LysR family transcriptional regulator, partial [Escherichia coli]|nr:LysR family transcriptional regulator [Escherichia coli]